MKTVHCWVYFIFQLNNHKVTVEIRSSHYKIIYKECALACIWLANAAFWVTMLRCGLSKVWPGCHTLVAEWLQRMPYNHSIASLTPPPPPFLHVMALSLPQSNFLFAFSIACCPIREKNPLKMSFKKLYNFLPNILAFFLSDPSALVPRNQWGGCVVVFFKWNSQRSK